MNNNLKEVLKKNPLIWTLNTYLKSYNTKKNYQRTQKYYDKRDICVPKIQFGSIDGFQKYYQNLRILYIGNDAGQDYSGLLQGLAKVAPFKVFEFPGIRYGQLRAVGKNGDFERVSNGRRLLELTIDHKDKNKLVDMVIGQMWAFKMDTRALDVVRSYGIPVVNIAMDDRHAYWKKSLKGVSTKGTFGLIGHIDLACTAAPECVEWYMKEGCPAIYLPEASDLDFFKPIPYEKKLYDVSFVGMRYGIREKIVRALVEVGLKVTVYGKGWSNGRIAPENIPDLFAKSRIVLGIGTIGYTDDFYSLKMRDFDGPMSGSMYLTHANPDLDTLYDIGKEIVTYNNVCECVEKAIYFSSHDEEREAIAQRGRARAAKDHSWEIRFSTIINTVLSLGYLKI